MNLTKVLTDIACDKPEEVKVTEEQKDNGSVLLLTVAPDDMGRVIGKHGKIARSIRLVIKAAASGSGRYADVEIKDKEGK